MTATLHVCAGCKPADAHPGGAALRDALRAAPPGGVAIAEHPCLGPCGIPGRIALTAPGRWSWLLAGLAPGPDLADLATFIAAWQASVDGRVAKTDRPDALRPKILGRVPPQPAAPTPTV